MPTISLVLAVLFNYFTIYFGGQILATCSIVFSIDCWSFSFDFLMLVNRHYSLLFSFSCGLNHHITRLPFIRHCIFKFPIKSNFSQFQPVDAPNRGREIRRLLLLGMATVLINQLIVCAINSHYSHTTMLLYKSIPFNWEDPEALLTVYVNCKCETFWINIFLLN